jgi:hypothetical protein
MIGSTTSYATSMPRAPLDVSTVAIGLAGLTVLAGLLTGVIGGVAPALLVFVTGGLLAAILLVWHSLRSLAGDVTVDPRLVDVSPMGAAGTELRERKQRALRALKDIEQEHFVGKMDDSDFATLDAEYRTRAKDVIREIDATLDPYRAKAEALVKSHRARLKEAPPAQARAGERLCPSCDTANDTDAAFCKKCGEKLS